MLGGAADLSVLEMGKLAPKFLKGFAKFNGFTGGVVGVFDNGVQTYNDILSENYTRAIINGTQATAYTSGVVMLFTPAAPVGGVILIIATVSDVFQMIIED